MKNWQINEYEVLDSQSHHYTSTSVSGGGGQISQREGFIEGHINAITSQTDFHRDQEVWVRNLKGGKESKFDFSDFDLSVRPGHRLVILTDPETNEIERIYNRNTEGFYSPGRLNKSTSHKKSQAWVHAIMYTVTISIPVLGYLFFLGFAAGICGEKDHLWSHASREMRIRTLLLAFLCANSIFIGVAIGVNTSSVFIGVFMFPGIPLASAFFFARYYVNQTLLISKGINSVSDEIDMSIAKFVRNGQLVT